MALRQKRERVSFRDRALDLAIGVGNERLRKAIVDADPGEGEWRERVETVVAGLLEAAADEPELAELCLVHAQGMDTYPGPFDLDLVEALAAVLSAGREGEAQAATAPPASVEELAAYGILGVVSERLRRGEADSLRELGDELSELATLPFAGTSSAA